MKLIELFPHPEDVMDPEMLRRDAEASTPTTDTALTDRQEKIKPPARTSNVAKAKRIRNLARMKVRDIVKGQDHEDTAYSTPNLGDTAPWEMGGL